MLHILIRSFYESSLGLKCGCAQDLLIHGAKYSILNEGLLRFEFVTSFHNDSDTISSNQLNQKFKLMVEALEYVIYSKSHKYEMIEEQNI